MGVKQAGAQNNTLYYTGIILKLENDKAIVLTDEFDFMELRLKPGMQRGQHVIFDQSDLYSADFVTKYKNIIKPFSVLISSAAIFLIIFFSLRFASVSQEYAYIDLDINPSLELVINKKETVIDVKAFNEEAKSILNEANPEDMLLYDALSKILDISKKKGYLNSTNNIVLFSTSISSARDNASERDEGIQEIISTLKVAAEDAGVRFEIIPSTEEERQKALDQSLSMGRYAIYSKAVEEGINLDLEDARNLSVSEILNKLNLSNASVPNNQEGSDVMPTIWAASEPTPSPTSVYTTTAKETATQHVEIPETLSTAISVSTAQKTPSSSYTTAPIFTQSGTPVPTNRVEITLAPTPTPTLKSTPKPTSTPTLSSTPKPTSTPAPTLTSTPKPTSASTSTPKPTSTSTPKPTSTSTYTASTSTPASTPTASTSTPTLSPTSTPTVSASTPALSPSSTPTTSASTPTLSPSSTPTVSASTPTLSPSSTPTASTSTPTLSPSSTPTASTSTPTLSPSSTPTGTDLLTRVELQAYNHIRDSETKELQPRIKLINTGNTPITLSDVKIRYYYTRDRVINEIFTCDWSNITASKITGTVVHMTDAKPNADSYIEIGFTDSAGILKPGQNVEIVSRTGNSYALSLATPPYSEWNYMYDQESDYSFNNASKDFVVWDKITVYISGNLYWGIEP